MWLAPKCMTGICFFLYDAYKMCCSSCSLVIFTYFSDVGWKKKCENDYSKLTWFVTCLFIINSWIIEMKPFGASLIFISFFYSCASYPGEEKHDIGTLAGDIQNWAMLIQNYILQVCTWQQDCKVVIVVCICLVNQKLSALELYLLNSWIYLEF